MTITQQDLQDFHRFGEEQLAGGGTASIDDLVAQWKAKRERERSVSDIRKGIAEYEEGKAVSVDEAFAEVKEQLRRGRSDLSRPSSF